MKPYRPYFQRALESSYPDAARQIQADIANTFDSLKDDVAFSKHSVNPVDRRLEMSAYFLALIIVLDKRGITSEKIRQLCLDIAYAYVKPESQFQMMLKKLPGKLIGTWIGNLIVPAFAKRIGQLAHPEGFKVQVITDPKQTFGLGYGFDIIECGICKQFTRHGYKHYANILCDVDHVTSGLAGLELIRSGTIANGATKCDFRFKRISN
jgi:hypothetical protein